MNHETTILLDLLPPRGKRVLVLLLGGGGEEGRGGRERRGWIRRVFRRRHRRVGWGVVLYEEHYQGLPADLFW